MCAATGFTDRNVMARGRAIMREAFVDGFNETEAQDRRSRSGWVVPIVRKNNFTPCGSSTQPSKSGNAS